MVGAIQLRAAVAETKLALLTLNVLALELGRLELDPANNAALCQLAVNATISAATANGALALAVSALVKCLDV